MFCRITFSIVSLLLLALAAAPPSGAVDGVLSYDSSAVKPIYLRAFDLVEGERITGATLHINDRTALPTRIRLVPCDPTGHPDWGLAVSTIASLFSVEGEVLEVDLGFGPFPDAGRIWLAVEFGQGTDSLEEGVGGGPALGYYQRHSPLGSQLLSPDGGLSFDFLSPDLTLAMELRMESTGSGAVSPAGAMMLAGQEPRRALPLHAAPNPFNPRTELFFELPQAGEVELVLYDVRGRKVRTLVEGHRPSGLQSVMWDGRDGQGVQVASGTLYARLRGPGITQTARLVLLQ